MSALKKQDMKKQDQTPPRIPTPLDGPTPEEALMREVDEAMRQERLRALWDRYGNWAIGGLIALVAFVAVFSASRGWMDSRNESATAQISALQDGQTIAIDDLPSGQATIARLLSMSNAPADEQRALAQDLAKKGDDPVARQLGRLLSIRLSDAGPEERLTELDSLIALSPSYFAGLAALDAAAIAIEGLNNPARAEAYLSTAEQGANGDQDILQMVDRLRVLTVSIGQEGAEE